jgi:hypothetical protein
MNPRALPARYPHATRTFDACLSHAGVHFPCVRPALSVYRQEIEAPNVRGAGIPQLKETFAAWALELRYPLRRAYGWNH